jgi:hypothetical protein
MVGTPGSPQSALLPDKRALPEHVATLVNAAEGASVSEQSGWHWNMAQRWSRVHHARSLYDATLFLAAATQGSPFPQARDRSLCKRWRSQHSSYRSSACTERLHVMSFRSLTGCGRAITTASLACAALLPAAAWSAPITLVAADDTFVTEYGALGGRGNPNGSDTSLF